MLQPKPYLFRIISFFPPQLLASLALLLAFACSSPPDDESADTSYEQWQPLTLSFKGPATGEQAAVNPFLHYRLTVRFTHGDTTYAVPGYYAADGQAAESSADTGSVWQVHFVPPSPGLWSYQVSFQQGDSLAIRSAAQAGEPLAFDGTEGSFRVTEADTTTRGRLRYVGKRYFRFSGNDAYLLKGGAGSPENLLGYADFDGTFFGGEEGQRQGEAAADKQMHQYQDHVRDWHPGDPTWQGGKGKGLIGGLNYLARQGMNSMYFLTMNIGGDGKDVWPYTGYDERYRFDVSKLAQWERVLAHADSLGIVLHMVLQETENERILDSGNVGPQRRLYYREMIARFAHHRALIWDMGEENGYAKFSPNAQTTEQRQAMFQYFAQNDPYQNPVVVHTHAWDGARDPVIEPLLGNADLNGIALQEGTPAKVHAVTKQWIAASAESGRPWVVSLDEVGPHYRGAMPDEADPNHDTLRHEVLWGSLMAGGGGVEWYFGYRFDNDDLGLETWRTRANLWAQTRHALEFFRAHLPYWEMQSADALVHNGTYCLAKPGEVYAIYLPPGHPATLDLEAHDATYAVHWYDPKQGGELQEGDQPQVSGTGQTSLGNPPGGDATKDWAVLVRRE
ncbi:MAG: DUF5060 domain-containing protein [Tunicatimonas sp.]